MNAIAHICRVIFLCCATLYVSAQSSVLSSGDWYKVAVEKNGVYKISYDMLRKMGINPSQIDPRHIRIFGREGGMLPQANNVPRPGDLLECAIAVTGEGDGRFDKGDYILFYAEGPDDSDYDLNHQIFRYENNLYSDRNYYFLTIGADNGKRIATSENIPGDFPVIDSFNAHSYYEKDAVNIDRSGREWFGEKFGLETSYTLTYSIPGITAGSTIRIVSDVMGQSYSDASFKLFFNDVQIGEQKISPIPTGRYSVKGVHQRDTLVIKADDVNASSVSSQVVKYEFAKGTGYSQGYLDFILIDYMRDLALYDNQTIFLSASSTANAHSTFRIRVPSNDIHIWDVTDHYNAMAQEFVLSTNEARFSVPSEQLRTWIVFNSKFPEPTVVGKIANQNLSGMATPNLLIITHDDFRSEAERLAAHRASFSNWNTAVVTVDEIYNQFSGGRQDVSALRDFIKLLRDRDPDAFKAVLLFGKGSYDYKDRLPNNTNFVPTYESRNSLHPLQTYSSDDYFVFLEDSEGEWSESPAKNHTLDAGVGRLPVTSPEEARNVVDKIIRYETGREEAGAWRKKIVFVADDGNSEDTFTSLHQYQSDQLAIQIEQNVPAMDPRRLFMGTYKKIVQPNGENVPGLVDDIRRAFDLGALIINFTGHGSEQVWTDERVLTEKTIEGLKNEHYPFLVTATCEFGRQDDPLLTSTAERSVTKKDAGSIGLITTARPVNAPTNFTLNSAFYEALFERDENGYATIGEVFRKTKNNSTSGVSNRNFSLIADPSMVLAIPGYSIEVTSLKTASGSDTLKGLSIVTAVGDILDPAGVKSTTFNGVVEATLYDREKEYVTIGRNDPPFHYQQWDNAVFRGRASVKDGSFVMTFMLPANITADIRQGKFSLYAHDETTGIDAKGVNTAVPIGGTESDVVEDTTPPSIKLYMGDTTFVDGGVTTPDTYLVARLEDKSGINISSEGNGNSIIARLDTEADVFILNDYYVSDVDTYQRGSIRFPVLGLAPGVHTMTLYAWDIHNNPAEATISFRVTAEDELVIEEFGNYPNPFQDNTTLFLTHNRSGDDLKAQLFIFTLAGELIRSGEISIAESQYHIDLMELHAHDTSGKKLPPGLYLARVILRSMTNGSKNEKVTKLIVLN